MTRHQDIWNRITMPVGRPGVLRVLKAAQTMRFLLVRCLIWQNPWHQTGYRINQHRCGDLAARQDIVADGELLINHTVKDTLVNPFVMAADQDQMRADRQILDHGLSENPAFGGQGDGPDRLGMVIRHSLASLAGGMKPGCIDRFGA